MVFTGRKSVRLTNFDYSTSAAYFITICVQDRHQSLSRIENAQVRLKPFGELVHSTWLSLEERYPYVVQDYFAVMPDHLHGILMLMPSEDRRKPVTQLIGAFKTIATKQINEIQRTPGKPFFQRGFYERVIRSDEELFECRRYIEENPLKWSLDKNAILTYPWIPKSPGLTV